MEIKRKKRGEENKVKATFSLNKNDYKIFNDECRNWGQDMSPLLNEFIKRVGSLLKSGEGGEVVFAIEGANWKQPSKILYDGKEIVDRDGIRQLKKSEEKKK